MASEDTVDVLLDQATRRFHGLYRGLVTDNADPTRRGRLKVSVPAVMGDAQVWALPCTPYAGDRVGFFALPDVGVGLWISFEAGHANHPVWMGCFWGDNQIDAADAVPSVKFLRTSKLRIRIDDDAGELLIENDTGSSLRITSMDITQSAHTVTQKTDSTRTVLDAIKFDVNDGAFTVT